MTNSTSELPNSPHRRADSRSSCHGRWRSVIGVLLLVCAGVAGSAPFAEQRDPRWCLRCLIGAQEADEQADVLEQLQLSESQLMEE
jgi:hypothetical protein